MIVSRLTFPGIYRELISCFVIGEKLIPNGRPDQIRFLDHSNHASHGGLREKVCKTYGLRFHKNRRMDF